MTVSLKYLSLDSQWTLDMLHKAKCLLLVVVVFMATALSLPLQAQSPRTQFDKATSVLGTEIDRLEDVAKAWPLPVYSPWNAAVGTKQRNALRAVQKKYRDRPPASAEELDEIASALGPFIRYLKLYETFYSHDTILVPPKGVASIEVNSYCLDAGRASPGSGEPLQLVRYDDLFPSTVIPIYQSLMRYNAQQQSDSIQGLLWSLRSISDGTSSLSRLSASDLALLEKVHPGSVGILQRTFALDGVLPKIGGKPVRSIQGYLKGVGSQKLSEALGSHGIAWNPGDSVETTLTQMAGLKPEGTADPNHAYTQLAPGVVARSIGVSGHSRFKIDLVNTSSAPFIFNNTQYVASPSRKAQRLAIGRASNPYQPTSLDKQGYTDAKSELMRLTTGPFLGVTPNKIPGHCQLISPSIFSNAAISILTSAPLIGEIVSASELLSGNNFFTGQKLTVSERLFAGVNIALVATGPFKHIARATGLTGKLKQTLLAAGDRVFKTNMQMSREAKSAALVSLAAGRLAEVERCTSVLDNAAAALQDIMNSDQVASPGLTSQGWGEADGEKMHGDKSAWECKAGKSGKVAGLIRQLGAEKSAEEKMAEKFHEGICEQL